MQTKAWAGADAESTAVRTLWSIDWSCPSRRCSKKALLEGSRDRLLMQWSEITLRLYVKVFFSFIYSLLLVCHGIKGISV